MSTPLQFKLLSIRNFLSFGNITTVVDLSSDGSTLIQGINMDTAGANGCGKTSLINAVCYAFYNKPFDSSISLQRLINQTNNTKNTLMEVSLTFIKGSDDFEIYRCRGETYNIKVTKNGEDITLDSVSENDKLVVDIIGMSYELFTKVVIFSGSSVPFLQTAAAQQRNQIEELFNITLLTEKAVRLKEVIKSTEQSLTIQEAVVKEQEAQVVLYNKQLKDAEARVLKWEDDKVASLATLNSQSQLLETVDMEVERQLHSLVSQLKEEETSVNSKLTLAKKDRLAIAAEVKKMDDELTHLSEDKCPYCLQGYEGAGDKLVEKVDLMVQKQAKLAELDAMITELDAAKTELASERTSAEEVMKFPSLAAAVKAEGLAQSAQGKITDLENAENPHIDALESLAGQAIKTVSYAIIDDLKREIEHQQFLLKLLVDKNSFIRRKILNKTIPFLNSRLMYYTKQAGLPHVVKFDDDMSCTVAEYGRELDFGNLSGGEKKRVNLSLSLAFRDVLHHLHSRVNCLFIDEIDASLDGSGVEDIFKMLKQKTRDEGLGLWIISHRPEAVGRFDRTMIVKKENGFSRILEEEEAADLL